VNPLEAILENIADFLTTTPEFVIIGVMLLTMFRVFRRVASRTSILKPLAPRKHASTSIECTNCGLANPSVWEKCERCGAPLGTKPSEPTDADLPPLIKKI
jgi:hypothetical protein